MASIQENIDKIMTLFQEAGSMCIDVTETIRQMNEEIAKLPNEYTGMASGIINPFFKLLNTAEIVYAYVEEFTVKILSKESLTSNQFVIIVKMIENANNIAVDIKKLL
jgi:hypothetical protein